MRRAFIGVIVLLVIIVVGIVWKVTHGCKGDYDCGKGERCNDGKCGVKSFDYSSAAAEQTSPSPVLLPMPTSVYAPPSPAPVAVPVPCPPDLMGKLDYEPNDKQAVQSGCRVTADGSWMVYPDSWWYGGLGAFASQRRLATGVGSARECIDRCAVDAGCKSWGYNAAGGECRTYGELPIGISTGKGWNVGLSTSAMRSK